MSSLACGAKLLKYCLFAFNLVFFVAGLLCLVVGVYFMFDNSTVSRLIQAATEEGLPATALRKPADIHTMGLVMTVVGAVMLLVAFLGCCGAAKEWRPLLVLYAICLMVILSIEIAMAIYAFFNKNNLETQVKSALLDTLQHYAGEKREDKTVRRLWDQIMVDNQCCGVDNNQNEFVNSSWFKQTLSDRYSSVAPDSMKIYPAACCAQNMQIRVYPMANEDDPICKNPYENGCFPSILESLRSRLSIGIGVAFAAGFVQLFGLIFSLCLCRAISSEDSM